MVEQTRGIVLRAIKYGETSLIVHIFTERYGNTAYIVQGVRSSKARHHRAGLLQPATLLDMSVYHKPYNGLQRIREFHPPYIYQHLQEEVVKNSIALFSVEVLLRLLPEHAPIPEVFEFCYNYFCTLDRIDTNKAANFPVYFITRLGEMLGYKIGGNYTPDTPHLNLQEGAFTSNMPLARPYVPDEDAHALSALLNIDELEHVGAISMNADARYRLLDWYLEFLHRHTQHMGNIKSLSVLRAILH